jgi:hypothetical protein
LNIIVPQYADDADIRAVLAMTMTIFEFVRAM